MSEQRKDTQRFWWRLHKAIALAPEMSGLLLVRYLQQGTPWTEEQKQALRQVVLKQSAALTWQQFAAVDLIDSGGELTDTLVLLESFAIYIDHRLRSFVEDASRTYRERVVGGQAAQTGATASPMYRERVVGVDKQRKRGWGQQRVQCAEGWLLRVAMWAISHKSRYLNGFKWLLLIGRILSEKRRILI
jgi:hypothetical protein